MDTSERLQLHEALGFATAIEAAGRQQYQASVLSLVGFGAVIEVNRRARPPMRVVTIRTAAQARALLDALREAAAAVPLPSRLQSKAYRRRLRQEMEARP